MTMPVKPGIIFDFDDTLVETTVFFENAREKFARMMVDLGFPLQEVLDALDRFDIENVRRCGGFMKDCFPRAMVQTYSLFCGKNGVDPDPGLCKTVEDLGWWVFEQKPQPVPGAVQVLEELTGMGNYTLILATKGDPAIQWERIGQSGLKGFFEMIYVLRDKSSRQYREISRRHDLKPECSWVVGNSLKSDINPGIRAGFNCIYIPNCYTWSYEMEEPAGDFITLDSLGMVPDLVLKRKMAV